MSRKIIHKWYIFNDVSLLECNSLPQDGKEEDPEEPVSFMETATLAEDG